MDANLKYSVRNKTKYTHDNSSFRNFIFLLNDNSNRIKLDAPSGFDANIDTTKIGNESIIFNF